jgi:hypothetical protein
MVRVHHGCKVAYLKAVESYPWVRIAVCREDGNFFHHTDLFEHLDQAVDWLAYDHWKLKSAWQYVEDMDGEFDLEPVYPNEQVIVDRSVTEGELSVADEVDWILLRRGDIVYNVLDGRLWVVDLGYDREKEHSSYAPRPKMTPSYRRAHAYQWEVPKEPDVFYEKFIASMKRKYPDKEITSMSFPPYGEVAYLAFPTSRTFVSVEIKKDEDLGRNRVMKIIGKKEILCHTGLEGQLDHGRKNSETLKGAFESIQRDSWEDLFPKEWDVVAVSRREFYERTFAGHCYQTGSFFGADSVPKGYVIAWENRYDDMLLVRLGSDGTIRCPSEYKGKVIGTGGGNIKGIARKFGREHWQVKLV